MATQRRVTDLLIALRNGETLRGPATRSPSSESAAPALNTHRTRNHGDEKWIRPRAPLHG